MRPISTDRYGSQRCHTKNFLSILFLVLVSLASGQTEYSQADLEAMTEYELEDICVKRGFQLVNDESDELTKQDYIEAAQRCLAIEQEMNELLAQYPELADELEEEIKRMEQENSEKQSHVDSLESKISNDSTNRDPSDLNMAFTQPAKARGRENYDYIGDEVEDDEVIVSEEIPLDEPIDDNSLSATYDEVDSPASEHDEVELSSPHANSDSTQLYEDNKDSDTTTTEETGMESTESTIKEDFTLSHLAIESLRVFVKNAQDDVKRIINLAIPVLQPLFNVGDAAWRQMKTLFVRAREVYEAYQATNMPPNEATGTPDTCDDSVRA